MANKPATLARSIARWDLVAVVLNGVIGAGIFGMPSRVFALAGGLSVLAFVVCAVCVVFMVLSFAEVSSRFGASGGPYLYALETFGPLTGFTAGWLIWVSRVTSFAANCNLLPNYLGLLFPGASSGMARLCILTTVVVGLAAINVRGVRVAADASNVMAAGKLLPLAIFIVAGLFFLDPARFHAAAAPGYHAFSQAVMLLVYAFTGFEMAVVPGGEARNPQRDLPVALLIGMAAVVVFYVLIQVVCIGTLPGLATSQRPLGDAAARFLGTGGAVMITAGMAISLVGNLNVSILGGSRLIYAMAERGGLPRSFAGIDPRYRTPIPAVLATTAVMLALTLSGTFIYLATVSTLARLWGYMLTCGALPVLRRRADVPAPAFRMPADTVVAMLGVAVCVWLLSSTTLREARDTVLALMVGVAIYTVCAVRRQRED